jgi:hypothetical protein
MGEIISGQNLLNFGAFCLTELTYHIVLCFDNIRRWISASRPMPPASVLQHPASQSGTGLDMESAFFLFRYRADLAGQSGIPDFKKIAQR